MLQKDYIDIEARYLCDVCSEAVTNPLCPSCLTIEIEAWLTLYPDLRKRILSRLLRYLKETEEKCFDSTTCIKCRDKRASVCPYCFTELVLRELKKIKANRMVLKEFLRFFNFDFEHTGYMKYAESLGVI